MTPVELLEKTLLQFETVLLSETQLTGLLEKALIGFQDIAGVVHSVKTSGEETEVDAPEQFLSAIGATDARGEFYSVSVGPAGGEDESGKLVIDDPGSHPPYDIHYLVRLTDWPEDEDLPDEILGRLMDYLTVLIEIPNTRRLRAAGMQAGLQMELMSDSELNDKKNNIEMMLEENKAMLPMFTTSA